MNSQSSRPPAIALALGAVALAALITVVVLLALGLGPFAPSAQPTSEATIAAEVTPSEAATEEPTTAPIATPSGSPTASLPPATPSSATDALLAHVPEPLRPSCMPVSFEQPILAVVSCTAVGGAIAVTYTLYADQPSMAAVYDATVIAVGIDDSSGRCYNLDDNGEITATTSRWPAENGYTIQDEPVGRYLCRGDGTTATMTWTNDRLYVLASASIDAAAVDELIAFWINEAGPID